MLALLATLGACDDGPGDRPARHDCEAVLAHLLVLEDGADLTMCKYHPSCDGSERKRFMAMCPKVLTRREARCYQRATSLAHADLCLPRADLDARIQGGGAAPRPTWLGL